MPPHSFANTMRLPQTSDDGVDAKAVLFDAYGTLFDVHSVAQLAESLFPGKGQLLSVVWRDKQVEYSRLVTICNNGTHYQPFSALTRAALIFAIKAVVARTEKERAAPYFFSEYGPAIDILLTQYQHLDPFPENLSVLQQLKSQGIVMGILSNGDKPMLQAAVSAAGFNSLIDHVISVDAIRKFKTHPNAYALGAKTLGLSAKEILFVSSNAWDALGATWYGYQTLWVNRYNLPFEELGTQPSCIGRDLHDVMPFFLPS